jgi:glycosyltransferase involved in cell wall biosynthesis
VIATEAAAGPLKVLVVSAFLPSRTSGGRVRLRALVRGLARTHSVTLLSFLAPGEERAEADEARLSEIHTVPNERIGLSGPAKRRLQARSFFSRHSYERLTYDGRAFQQALDDLLAHSRFDVVHVEGSAMAHLAYPAGLPVVLDEQNIEYDVLRRAASVTRSFPRKVYNRLNALKIRIEEERSWRSVDACAVPSARDESFVRRVAPRTLAGVVPNGVDLEFFTPVGMPVERGTVLFFGQLGYYPNTDALGFFLNESWPLLRRTHPSARLVIVGPSVPPEIQRWAGDDITITGAVPDVRPHLERAEVIIVPLRIGGGTRLKILEALAMERPVVSTALGAEGLDVTHGRDILVADSAASFAAEVGRVLDEERYGWDVSVRSLERLYRSAIAGATPPIE